MAEATFKYTSEDDTVLDIKGDNPVNVALAAKVVIEGGNPEKASEYYSVQITRS